MLSTAAVLSSETGYIDAAAVESMAPNS